jgi:hypothetical protein
MPRFFVWRRNDCKRGRLCHAGPSSSQREGGKTLRTASGRAGAAEGASRASRTPECGMLCCRRGGWMLCSMWRGALLFAGRDAGRCSAPHPAELELPRARAELRALRSAARSAAACGGLSSAPCGAELFLFAGRERGKTLRTQSARAGAAVGASRASRTPECIKRPTEHMPRRPN